MQTLTVYTKDYCPYCTMTKNLLTSLDIQYEEIDISKNPEVIMDLMKRSGMRTVPQIFLGEECLGGYDQLSVLHREGRLLEKLGV